MKYNYETKSIINSKVHDINWVIIISNKVRKLDDMHLSQLLII